MKLRIGKRLNVDGWMDSGNSCRTWKKNRGSPVTCKVIMRCDKFSKSPLSTRRLITTAPISSPSLLSTEFDTLMADSATKLLSRDPAARAVGVHGPQPSFAGIDWKHVQL